MQRLIDQKPAEGPLDERPRSQTRPGLRRTDLMGIAGLAFAVAGFVSLFSWSPGDALLALGIGLLAVSAYARSQSHQLGHGDATPEAGARRRGEPDGNLEYLKDAQWEIVDRNLQYRKLLDAQQDFVVQRGCDGHIVFANTRFCRAFDVSPQDIVGTIFYPPLIASEPSSSALVTGRRLLQLMRTVDGERWISWDQHNVRNSTGGSEMQSVGRDITSERKAEDELKAACRHAEAADHAKSRFLAFVSYELRAPANTFLGTLELLGRSDLSSEQRSSVCAAERSAKALLKLSDEILAYSKIEAQELVLAPSPLSIRA